MSQLRAPAAFALLAVLLLAAAPATGQDGPAFLVRDIDTTGDPILFDPPCVGFCPPPQDLFGSYPSQLLPVGDRLYFVADDRIHGAEVWRSDGTGEGTVQVTDVCPGVCSSTPLLLGALDDEVVFWANDGTNGMELWKTDGTPEGTELVREICPGPCDGLPTGELSWLFTRVQRTGLLDGSLYFEARPWLDPQTQPHGRIWRTDGTAAGTEEVLDLCSEPECEGNVGDFVPLGSSLLVATADLDDHRAALWAFGPPDRAPELLARSCGEFAAIPHGFVHLGSRVLFASQCLEPEPIAPSNATGIYGTDGTPEGTTLVVHQPGGGGLLPQLRLGPYVYFHGPGGLWRTDGTPGPGELALPYPPGVVGIEEPVPLHGAIFFLGVDDETLSFPLWRTEQGAESPRLLLDSSAVDLTPIGDVLLFLSFEPGFGHELWVSDGTEIGTRMVQDVQPGPDSSVPRSFARAGDTVFFSADDGAHDRELWAIRLPRNGPPHPPAPDLVSSSFPDFRFWVRITGQAGDSRPGVQEIPCLPETVCVSGALPGRSEVFLRIVGPKPNGKLWPTLVKFSTSTVEVWIEQEGTAELRYYRLPGAVRGVDELPGLFDRRGFDP